MPKKRKGNVPRIRAGKLENERAAQIGIRSRLQREQLVAGAAEEEDIDEGGEKRLRMEGQAAQKADGDDMLAFEDDFEDEEDEEDWIDDEDDEEEEEEDDDDDDDDDDGDVGMPDDAATRQVIEAFANGTLEDPKDPDMEDEKVETRPWRPGVDPLEEGEELDYDSSAYYMLHRMNIDWPSLSFDFIRDDLGYERSKFPMTAYSVSGTQAHLRNENKLLVLKMSDLHKTKNDDDEDDDDDSGDESDDLDDDPVLEYKQIPVKYATNRIRTMPQMPNIAAVWTDTPVVHMYDLKQHIKALDAPGSKVGPTNPVYSFNGHSEEGFALDWSKKTPGRFLSGDCKKNIFLWEPQPSGVWMVDAIPYSGHKASVEDLQWSPTENNVFASCSVDQHIKIWDARKKKDAAISVHAHSADVNVISWNTMVNYLLVSGSDDGSFRIWDLRNFKSNKPVAHFKWHNGPITSVEWHPTDDSMLAVSGADDQITIWDLSVEADDPDEQKQLDVPPQLLFVHLGQKDVKEIHWHPQAPGVLGSTAGDGFNIFKPSNC